MVSIVIPVYNMESYLAETIESALAQTYTDTEIVVVDDGSTDGTIQVAMQYCPRIRLVHKANGGLGAARNTAIEHARGEFILPLDSDDLIAPEYLERTMAKMTSVVGVVSTYMQVFGLRNYQQGAPNSYYPIFAPTKEQILAGNTLPVCSLIRRAAFDEVGGYRPCDVSEDWALWAGIVCKTNWKIEIVPEYLFFYRTREKSMITTGPPFEQTREKIRAMYA